MPKRKRVSSAAMLLAVVVALPSTMSLPGTYRRAKKPGIEAITYSKPANLPGFLVKLIGPPPASRAWDMKEIIERSPRSKGDWINGFNLTSGAEVGKNHLALLNSASVIRLHRSAGSAA